MGKMASKQKSSSEKDLFNPDINRVFADELSSHLFMMSLQGQFTSPL